MANALLWPRARFEWDDAKDQLNQRKHCVSFSEAQHAFVDPSRRFAQLDRSPFRVRGAQRTRRADGPIYVPDGRDTNLWRRILAQRKARVCRRESVIPMSRLATSKWSRTSFRHRMLSSSGKTASRSRFR